MASDPEFRPVWPELAEVIAESPVVLIRDRFFIVQLSSDELPADYFALFQDEVERTALVRERSMGEFPVSASRGPYKMLRLVLARPFSAPGFLASVSLAVARMKVNQLLYSTYSFDYVLVNESDLSQAKVGLKRMGFEVVEET